MKTLIKHGGSWITLLAILICVPVYGIATGEEEMIDTTIFKAFSGKVIDSESARTLPFATIEATGSNIATVTNIDGEFTIKVAKNAGISELKVSYIGFSNKNVKLSQFNNRELTINLSPSSVQLKEITVRPQNAMELMADVLANVRKNYSDDPMMMRGFYRETILRGRNYVSISEAIIIYHRSEIKIGRNIRRNSHTYIPAFRTINGQLYTRGHLP